MSKQSKTKTRRFNAMLKLSKGNGLSGPSGKIKLGYRTRKTKTYHPVGTSPDTGLTSLGSGYAINFRPLKFSMTSRTTKFGVATVVSGHGRFGAIVSAGTLTSNPGIFTGAQFAPLKPQALPRLAAISPLFMKYRFTKLKWIFVTSCSVTVQGNFVISWMPDGHLWNDSEYTSLTYNDFTSNNASAFISVKEPMGSLTVSASDLGGDQLYFCDYHSTASASADLASDRQSIQGTIGGIFANVFPSTGFGDLFLEYECELYEPVMRDPTPLWSRSPDVYIPVPRNFPSNLIYDRNEHKGQITVIEPTCSSQTTTSMSYLHALTSQTTLSQEQTSHRTPDGEEIIVRPSQGQGRSENAVTNGTHSEERVARSWMLIPKH